MTLVFTFPGQRSRDPGMFQRLLALDLLEREHFIEGVVIEPRIPMRSARFERAVFVEVGPRRVLCDTLNRKWRSNPRFTTDPGENHSASFGRLIEELSRAA